MSTQPPSVANALAAAVCDVLEPILSYAPNSTHPSSDVFHFLYREGRLPRIGDQRAPWTYCGWLLPYVISLHSLFSKPLDKESIELNLTARSTNLYECRIEHCPDRCGYHLRTLAAGELLDEPIPRIEFCGEFESSVRRIWEGEREGSGMVSPLRPSGRL